MSARPPSAANVTNATNVTSAANPASAKAWGVCVVAVVALAVLDALGKTRDPDVYWHLLTARTALETHGSLPRDVFSYSFEGAPWVYKDLVAELVLYVGFARLGYAWFAVMKGAVVVAIAGATYVAMRPRDRSALALLVSVGLVVSSFWLVERPNLFSLACFAWAIALVERARRRASGEKSPKVIASALVPIALLDVGWTSLHRFALLGHLLFFAFALMLACARLGARSPIARALLGPPPSRRFVGATFAAAIAAPVGALLNPNGLAAFTSGVTMAAHPELRAQFFEWKRVTLAELAGGFPIACVLVAIASAALAWRIARAVRGREADPPVTLWHAAILLALIAMTADSFRWLPYVAIASGLVLACVLADLLARASRPMPRGSSLLVAVLALALLHARQGDASLAVGEDLAWSPRGAVEFASSHGLRGRVANAFDFGGYLLWSSWPDVRVLVDGRNEILYDPRFVVRALLAEHDAPTFASMRADDGATWALALNTPEQVGCGFLARDPAWALAYWSDTASVYVRRDAHADLARAAYRFVDPYDVPASIGAAVAASHGDRATLDAILAEVHRMLDASPDSVRANLALALFFDGLGPVGRADRDAVLARLLVLTHDSPAIAALARSAHAEPAK